MISSINQLPEDILRLIFIKVANPLIAKTCKRWRRINTSQETIKGYLKDYEKTLGKLLYEQFVKRMHEWEYSSFSGFEGLMRRQWSLFAYYSPNIKKTDIFAKCAFSPDRVNIYEKRIAENAEVDLYSFCLLLLAKNEIHLQNESFAEGIRLTYIRTPSKERLNLVLTSCYGTKLWNLISKNIEMSVVKELTIDPCMMGIPTQIENLVGLENLSLHTEKPCYVPGEILKLTNLKHLDLGKSRKTYLAPELYESTNPVIVNAIKAWNCVK